MEDTNVILTAAEWRAIANLIRLTEGWRKGEIEGWERCAQEKNADGSPHYPYAQCNRDFMADMDATVKQTLKRIDGV